MQVAEQQLPWPDPLEGAPGQLEDGAAERIDAAVGLGEAEQPRRRRCRVVSQAQQRLVGPHDRGATRQVDDGLQRQLQRRHHAVDEGTGRAVFRGGPIDVVEGAADQRHQLHRRERLVQQAVDPSLAEGGDDDPRVPMGRHQDPHAPRVLLVQLGEDPKPRLDAQLVVHHGAIEGVGLGQLEGPGDPGGRVDHVPSTRQRAFRRTQHRGVVVHDQYRRDLASLDESPAPGP